MQNKQFFDRVGLALVVVRNTKGQYLTVLETKNRGWWLPGGRVESCEQFEEAAIRETLEEAGVHVTLKGVLRVEYNIDQQHNFMRFKIIYYAEPTNENEPIKSKADNESILAKWVDYKLLPQLSKDGPGWRGPELLEWSKYIENGGTIYPLSVAAREGSQVFI